MNGVFLSSVNDLWETTRQRSAAPPGIPPQSQPYGGAGGSKGNGNGGFSGTGPGSAQNPIHSVTSAGSSSRSVLGVWNHHNSLGVKATPLDNLRYLQQINRECQAQVAHQGHDCPMVGLRPFTHRASSDRNNMVLGSLSPEVGTGGPRAGGGDHHQYSNLEVPFASVRGVTGLPAAADHRGGGQRDDEGGRPTDNSAIGGTGAGEDNHNNTTRFSWGTDDAPSEIGRPEGRLGGRGSWLSSGPEGDESEGASEMMRGSPAGFIVPPLPGGIPGGGAEEGRGRAGGRYPSSSSDDDDEDTSEEDEEEEEGSSSSPSSGGSSSEGDSIPSQISPINHSAHHAPHHVVGNDSSWDASPPM